MQFISIKDYLLLPFYLLIVFLLANRFRNRHYPPGHPLAPYFMPALALKIVGAIGIGMVYQYYYGFGDTAYYFKHAEVINSALTDSPVKWFRILTGMAASWEPGYVEYISQFIWYDGNGFNTFVIASFAAVFGLVTFDTYLPTAALFAVFSFTGIWALFRTFVRQYPRLIRPVAISILFVPSVLVWGSGIFKDTVCMAGIGWLTHSVFELLLNNNRSFKNLFAIAISFWLIFFIKVYIAVAFLPALAIWIFATYSSRIQNYVLRYLCLALFIVVCVGGFLAAADTFQSELGMYSLQNMASVSKITRDYLVSSGGDNSSVYNLGTIEPTPLGMLKKFPQAVNVTLFRPYPWEANKVIIFMNSLESFALLLLTVWLLYKIGLLRLFNFISKDPNIQFCLVFTLMFAFAVGISTFNFGSLSRYKIPCTPFFCLMLSLLYYKYKESKHAL